MKMDTINQFDILFVIKEIYQAVCGAKVSSRKKMIKSNDQKRLSFEADLNDN